jgi:hypothetical protein
VLPLAAETQDFFTKQSLLTFQGSTLAVMVVANVAGYMFPSRDYLRKWIALVLALAIQVVVVLSVTDRDVWTWLIGALNALLVFSAAMGLNEAGSRGGGGRAAGRFFRSWLR